jgi:kynurenine formamidase
LNVVGPRDYTAPVMMRPLLVLGALLVSSCSTPSDRSPAFPAGPVVDLSHVYDSQTVFWPTAERFRLDKVSDGITPGGYYYAANNFFTAEHGGTHIDAPLHFAQGRHSVDQIPIDRLVGPAVVVDVRESASRDADYQVTVDDIARAERDDGQLPSDAILILRTGFSERWPDATRYLGTAERGEAAVANLHFPGLHPDTARWLVANRQLKAIGIDTASIDFGQSNEYQSHRILFERNIPAFENLTALERLPARGASVIALPMKIGGGSGAPLRAIAILPR